MLIGIQNSNFNFRAFSDLFVGPQIKFGFRLTLPGFGSKISVRLQLCIKHTCGSWTCDNTADCNTSGVYLPPCGKCNVIFSYIYTNFIYPI